MNTIVLGYDDTEPAKRALDRTAELARAFQANVVVVSVAPVLSPAAHGIGPIDPADPPELHEQELVHAKALLSERGIEAEYQLALGDPPELILDVAEEREGRHDRRRLPRTRADPAAARPECQRRGPAEGALRRSDRALIGARSPHCPKGVRRAQPRRRRHDDHDDPGQRAPPRRDATGRSGRSRASREIRRGDARHA